MMVPVPYMVPMWNCTVVAPVPATFMPAVQPAPAVTHAVGESSVDGEEMTTVIFRNIPRDCTRDMLTSTLDAEGFSARYNFVHVPVNFQNRAGLGYALVNMVNNGAALHAQEHFTGFCNWRGSTVEQDLCEVGWSNPMMHESVPEQCRPALYEAGKLVAFPEPTKR